LGETSGCVSPSPLICVISTTGSKRSRVAATSRVIGFPAKSFSVNISPPLTLPLCGIAIARPPVAFS